MTCINVDCRGIPEPLSPRERQIAALLSDGYAVLNVAALLEISENTVRTHIRRIYRKLRVVNRAQLARACTLAASDVTVWAAQA